jgi:SAM-dependent methyltransferase
VRPQAQQSDWLWQWSHFEDDAAELFLAWIAPQALEDFRGKEILDAGCGGGHHVRLVAPHAAEVVGVDLNCADVAAESCRALSNVRILPGDIATMDLGRQFDVVYSVGVLHHTDDPDAAFHNLVHHVKPGGRLIVWVYSFEGNALNRWLVEPLRRRWLSRWPRPRLRRLAFVLTALLYVPVYTLYMLPLPFLPFHAYFANFRRLGYRRNVLNVFDKLNAPQTRFLRRGEVAAWFATAFRDVHLSSYVGVSWRASGTRIG